MRIKVRIVKIIVAKAPFACNTISVLGVDNSYITCNEEVGGSNPPRVAILCSSVGRALKSLLSLVPAKFCAWRSLRVHPG